MTDKMFANTPNNESGDKWRWMILLCCFCNNGLFAGLSKSLGVLLPILEKDLDTKVWILGSVVAILFAIGDFIGKYRGRNS